MTRLLRTLAHEPVAFWAGLLTVLEAVLTGYGVLPQLAGVVTALITVLGGAAVRQSVTPVAADTLNTQMGQP